MINIDLVPHDTTVEDLYDKKVAVTVHECSGSILAKLDKPANECWTKYTLTKMLNVNDEWTVVDVQYDYRQEHCCFIGDDIDEDCVIRWLSDNFDRIKSVGYEALDHLPR